MIDWNQLFKQSARGLNNSWVNPVVKNWMNKADGVEIDVISMLKRVLRMLNLVLS